MIPMTKRRLYERRERHALVDILAAIAGGLIVQFSDIPPGLVEQQQSV